MHGWGTLLVIGFPTTGKTHAYKELTSKGTKCFDSDDYLNAEKSNQTEAYSRLLDMLRTNPGSVGFTNLNDKYRRGDVRKVIAFSRTSANDVTDLQRVRGENPFNRPDVTRWLLDFDRNMAEQGVNVVKLTKNEYISSHIGEYL